MCAYSRCTGSLLPSTAQASGPSQGSVASANSTAPSTQVRGRGIVTRGQRRQVAHAAGSTISSGLRQVGSGVGKVVTGSTEALGGATTVGVGVVRAAAETADLATLGVAGLAGVAGLKAIGSLIDTVA